MNVRARHEPRARPIAVAAGDPVIGDAQYDYADALEIRTTEPDPRSALEFARCALEQPPWLARASVWFVLRRLLRFQLAPASSPDHVLGWTIVASTPDMLHLEAISPLLGRGVLVGRRPDATSRVITTYVFFARPVSRIVWKLAGPGHRRIGRYLLTRAARTV